MIDYINIITNQSGIALGKYTAEDMHIFHQYLIKLLEREGIQIHGLLYFPHYDMKNAIVQSPSLGYY